MQTYAELITEIQAEFPDFQTVAKSQSKWMRTLGAFMKFVSFKGDIAFMTNYTTTIGHTVYTPDPWDSWPETDRIVVLRHERVHMRQQKRMGRIPFSFVYLVPFFPVFIAYFRAQLELEAYEESIRATIQYRGTGVVWTKDYREWLVSQFTTSSYVWMWPFRSMVTRWVNRAIEQAVDEYVGAPKKPRNLKNT